MNCPDGDETVRVTVESLRLKCQVLFKTSQSFLFQELRRAGSEMILAFEYLAIKEAIIF